MSRRSFHIVCGSVTQKGNANYNDDAKTSKSLWKVLS